MHCNAALPPTHAAGRSLLSPPSKPASFPPASRMDVFVPMTLYDSNGHGHTVYVPSKLGGPNQGAPRRPFLRRTLQGARGGVWQLPLFEFGYRIPWDFSPVAGGEGLPPVSTADFQSGVPASWENTLPKKLGLTLPHGRWTVFSSVPSSASGGRRDTLGRKRAWPRSPPPPPPPPWPLPRRPLATPPSRPSPPATPRSTCRPHRPRPATHLGFDV